VGPPRRAYRAGLTWNGTVDSGANLTTIHFRLTASATVDSPNPGRVWSPVAVTPGDCDMRVALVSPSAYPIDLGLRYISSVLKAAGHDVRMIFMTSRRATARVDFRESLLHDLVGQLRDRDLIGMSLMTNTFHRACALTNRIREAGLRTPIIWGGTHPTVAPDESLEVADIVCVGEGERPMLELVERLERGRDPTDVAGLAFREGGPFGNQQTLRNPPGPLEQDLDGYPFPDYELATHWVTERDRLVPARPENLRGVLRRLRILTTRGCPNRCTFCNNTAWRRIYQGRGPWVRKRSLENIFRELQWVRERFVSVEAVNIVDDLFFVRSDEEIAEFAAEYKRRINLPLELDASPNTITEAKIRALAELPISLISMGIESASRDTLENIYDRPTPIDRIARCIELLHRYRIPAEYHYLVSNPYEPGRNVIETMRFIASYHKGPARLRVFPLMFYPGTPLYERARADGLIRQRGGSAYEETYSGRRQFAGHDYLGVWLRVVLGLRNVGLSNPAAHRLIDAVTHPTVRRYLDHPWFTPLAFGGYQVGRKLAMGLVYQPFIRPLRRLGRRWLRRRRSSEDAASLPQASPV